MKRRCLSSCENLRHSQLCKKSSRLHDRKALGIVSTENFIFSAERKNTLMIHVSSLMGFTSVYEPVKFLFCHYYVHSIYCFDFFVFFVLCHTVNVTGSYTEDEPLDAG